jgi:hypothetical protein
MRKIINYLTITAYSRITLAESVNIMIQSGWQPYGYLKIKTAEVISGDGFMYIQVVVMYESNSPELKGMLPLSDITPKKCKHNFIFKHNDTSIPDAICTKCGEQGSIQL